MTIRTDDVPGLAAKTSIPSFQLQVFLRYTLTSPNVRKKFVKVQGVIIADVEEPPEPPPPPPTYEDAERAPAPYRPFDPPSHDVDPHLLLRAVAAPPSHPGFKLFTTMSFPLGHVISGLPLYVEGSFTALSAWGHDYVLTALGEGDEGRTCAFRPADVTNRLEPRGIYVDIEPPRSNGHTMPNEAVVVIKPLFRMQMDLAAALIDRQIQHYAMIGFTRYIVYLLPHDVEPLLLQPRVLKWVRQGMLVLLKWDYFPPHQGNPLWDQRVVYSHAVLAHLGRSTFVAMIDLDEYIVSLGDGATSVFDMVRKCTQPTDALVNLQLTRYHVIASDWPDRTQSEQPLWMPDTREEHPLFGNTLINLKYPPYYKTMVNPNFIKVFFVHVATSIRQYNVTRPDPHCMILSHSCNVNYGREHLPNRIAVRFPEDPIWVAALRRLRAQRQWWLAGSSSAAATTGPQGR